MFNEQTLKELTQDPRLQRIVPIIQRAAVDEHYKNGLLTAAAKAVSPDYAKYLELALNKISGVPTVFSQSLNPTPQLTSQTEGRRLFNV